MPIFNEGEELNYLEKDDILMSGSPDNFSKVKAQNLYNRTLTRTQLQALISANTLNIGQQYTISNAVSNTMALKVTATGTNILDNVAVRVSNGVNYIYNITTDTAEIIQQINGIGFVKANGTTITYDNSTYLTNINGITAGGELSGTYPNPSLSNNAVTGKVLTGLSISGSSIVSTDSILTSFGKLQNQINSLVGGVNYQGTWNAFTNTPALASSVGVKGYYYVVSVAGSTNLDGITDWKLGDWAIFDGITWQKVDNTDAVISVNGYTGIVTLTTSDINEGTNLYYTDARVRQAISENIVGINYDNNTGVFSLTNGYVIPTTTEQSNWNTAYNNRISSLTTLGNSGAATLIQNVLNIPNYTLSGLGGVPYTGATANVDLGEFGIKAGYFEYDLTPTNTPTTQGTTYWDSAEETVALIMNGAIQHIGLDTFYNVKNNTGFAIPKGTAVRFAGTDGNSGHLLIAPMLADGSYPSSYYMGITAEVIANGDFGKVIQFGKLTGINTNAYTNGDILYVSTTVAGSFQTTVPTAPNNIIIAAAVVSASNNGTLMVRATLGSNINSDEGVKITSPTTGQLLQLQSNGLWENKTKAQILGGTSSQFVKGDGSLDSNNYALLSSISGTTGKLPKFTASGAIGDSIVSESGSVISVAGALNITSTAPYIELTDSTNGIVHYLEGNDTSLVLYSDFGNTQSGSLIDFRIDGNTNRMSLSATELITFGATDTGEAHIFGGTGRFNGNLRSIGRVTSEVLTTGAAYFEAKNTLGSSYFGNDSVGAYIITEWNAPILFYTNNTEKMRITSGGNVGIGTTSPTSKLSISDGATMYAAQTGTLLDIKANVSNGNDTTSRVGLRLSNNSNAFNIWYGGTTDRLRFADGGGNEILTLVNGGVSASSLTVGSTIHTSKAGSISGYYLNLNTFNVGNQFPINRINGAYMAFPNATDGFIFSPGGDRFANHTFYSNDGLSSMKFGQYSAFPSSDGGGYFELILDKGNWGASADSYINFNIEEGFNLFSRGISLNASDYSSASIGAAAIYLNSNDGASASNVSILPTRITFWVNRIQLKPLTTTQVNALTATSEEGDIVYNSTLDTICFYNGSSWRQVSHTAM